MTIKTYSTVRPVSDEALRYSGCREKTPQTVKLLSACADELLPLIEYKICYEVCDVMYKDDGISIGRLFTSSETLKKALRGKNRSVIFCATIGISADRLLLRYSKTSASKALIMQGLGAERVEALCDDFCQELDTLPRVSPGYGDIPLAMQTEIFKMLDLPKMLGVTLNENLTMSPSKSVTAIAAINERQ